MNRDGDVGDIMNRYSRRLGKQVEGYETTTIPTDESFSREYMIFREEAMGTAVSSFENWALWARNIIHVKVKEENYEELQDAIDTAHLNLTPEDAASLGAVVSILFILMGFLVGGLSYVISGSAMSALSVALIMIISGLVLSKPIANFPISAAAKWRLKAGNQMVLCVLYVVMYMRHTSNLEHAVKFAGEHIGNPLALDLRKIFWDVETGKYSTIKASLDNYLFNWKKHNLEFVESFHLIESSLSEGDEDKRVERLEKALEIMIQGTYDRMLKFAHDLKTPITMLHMLGIILPILGLIILPLLGSFLGVKWWHLAIFYNIALPVIVYQMGIKILSGRPMGYGGNNILEDNPSFAEFTKVEFMGNMVDPKIPAYMIGGFFVLLGLLPLIFHFVNPGVDLPLGQLGSALDYRQPDGSICTAGAEKCIGPFGIGAAIFSLFTILGVAIAMAIYYKSKTKKLMVIQDKSKHLEKEFAGSLFQLGHRIGDGIPAELAFGKVAENMKGTPTGDFLNIVNHNIRRLGMSVNDAIFDSERGAMLSYPSRLIESSMKVLIESSKKGPQVVAKCLVSISIYVERINQVNSRLRDLLADITSSMKGQINFLTPMIAGVVVGIGTMITSIIGKLSIQLGGLTGGGGADVPINVSQLLQLFPTDKLIPPYFFQMVVGTYVIEIVIILTILSSQIQNGIDKLSEQNEMGKNLNTSIVFYFLISIVVTIIFTFLAGMIATFA